MTLYLQAEEHAARVVTLLPMVRSTWMARRAPGPRPPRPRITGTSTNGQSFFLVDRDSGRSLKDVWRDYVESLADDVEEDEGDDDGDEDGPAR